MVHGDARVVVDLADIIGRELGKVTKKKTTLQDCPSPVQDVQAGCGEHGRPNNDAARQATGKILLIALQLRGGGLWRLEEVYLQEHVRYDDCMLDELCFQPHALSLLRGSDVNYFSA